MGLLSDIVSIVKGNVDTDQLRSNIKSKKYSSISTRASEGTLQFPILISDAMDIDTAQMIVKALERNYATFVQTVLSMNSATSETDMADYLKQFHQNFAPSSNPLSGPNIISTFESYNCVTFDNGNVMISNVYEGSTGQIAMSNREQNYDMRKDLRLDILNRKYTPANESLYHFKNPELNMKHNNPRMYALLEDYPAYRAPLDDEIYTAFSKAGYDPTKDAKKFDAFANDYRARHKDTYELNKDKYMRDNVKAASDASTISANQNKIKINDAKDLRDQEMHGLNVNKTNLDIMTKNRDLYTFNMPQQMLKDNDVKKANELVSTTMHTRVHMLNKDKEPIGVHDFMLGIKGTMHPIKSEEMITNMVGACKNNDRVFNFFRWTTGEIGFFKDFWLNINEMKHDVNNESRGASKWWIALKNRRALSRIQASAFFKNRVLPNATIVLTAEEAELIKINYGYDVMNSYFMKKIMQTYYLLGFVVVDNAAQVAHFFFDGNMDFESVSFSGLEKENSRDERKFKEMLKVINRN